MPGYDDEYRRYANQQPVKQGPNPLLLVIVIVAIGWFLMNYGNLPSPGPSPVIDDNQPSQITALSDTYVVRVYETEVDKQPPWLIKLLNNRFWNEWLINDMGSKYVTFDPDNDQSASFLDAGRQLGKTIPFLIHARNGGEVIQIIELREGMTVDQIQQLLEDAVK